LILSISFVYQDLKEEIEEIKTKSNNDIFLQDREIYMKEIGEMQNKLDEIQANTQRIAEQLEIDIIEIIK
jgi:hypothetical protein